jgi:hypothetical protein
MLHVLLYQYTVVGSYGLWVRIAQSVQRPGTGWTVRGSNPDGGEIFRISPDSLWGPPSLLFDRYRVTLPRVKRPGRGVDHPPTSCTEVKEIIGLYLYFPPFVDCYRASFTFTIRFIVPPFFSFGDLITHTIVALLLGQEETATI